LISQTFLQTADLKTLPIIARALRLGRVVKFIRASRNISILIDTIYYILPSLLNIGALIFLIIFIYAVLGLNLFSGIRIESVPSDYPFADDFLPPELLTFEKFGDILIILLQCVTG
jgi:hypothetical protein